jgi:hypothetical protein
MNLYHNRLRHIPEYSSVHSHRRDNLRSSKRGLCLPLGSLFPSLFYSFQFGFLWFSSLQPRPSLNELSESGYHKVYRSSRYLGRWLSTGSVLNEGSTSSTTLGPRFIELQVVTNLFSALNTDTSDKSRWRTRSNRSFKL